MTRPTTGGGSCDSAESSTRAFASRTAVASTRTVAPTSTVASTRTVAPVGRARPALRGAALDDRGYGSAMALGIITVTLSLLTGGLLLAGVVLSTHKARAAADLAALAAATRVLRGADAGTACAVAREVAQRNDARLGLCRALGAGGGPLDPGGGPHVYGSEGKVEVETSAALPGRLAHLGRARARAVAGSADVERHTG